MTTPTHATTDMLDFQAAALYLGLEKPASLQANYRRWRIPVHRIGRYVRFKVADLDAWLADHREEPATDHPVPE